MLNLQELTENNNAPGPEPLPVAAIQPENYRTSNPAPINELPGHAKRSSKKILPVLLAAALIMVLVGGCLLYVYFQKLGPFSIPMYSESNFFSGLLGKADQINTASYTLSGSMEVVAREKDAAPFSIKEPSNAAELKKEYTHDYNRIQNVSTIISQLNDLSNYDPYYHSDTNKETPYPTSIETLFDQGKTTYSYENGSVKDPVTGKTYVYAVTEGGKNFRLTVDFETNDAIKAISNSTRYGNSVTSTIVEGKKVIFTKDSHAYSFSMSNEPPKPFIQTLSDSLRMISPDTSVKCSVGASSDLKSQATPDWKFNVDAEGDFGDLAYKVNADALRKNDTYYFKINNFPSLFLIGDLGLVKGKWVSIAPNASTIKDNDSFSMLSILKENISKIEKGFKDNRQKSVKFIKIAMAAADEEKLIVFKNKPTMEKVNGQELIRYELGLKKEAILPFYSKLQEEINGDPDFSDFKFMIDQGLIDYLKSDEFTQVFDYFDKNNTVILWTDTQGFPAMSQDTMRIVPPDTATQLAGKQIQVVSEITIADINKPLDIMAPTGATPIDKMIDDYNKNADDPSLSVSSRAKARDARRLSDMRQLVSAQEMYYGDNDKYLTSAAYPNAIGYFINPTPKDPLDDSSYGTVNNTLDNSSFCYYAKLEEPNTTANGCIDTPCAYYTASQGGNFYKTIAPTTLDTMLASGCGAEK